MTRSAAMNRGNKTIARAGAFKDFAWQGFFCRVPEEWSLDAFHGNSKSGYAQLSDLYQSRMELRWETDRREADIDKVVQRYIRTIKKVAQKQKIDIEVERHLSFGGKRLIMNSPGEVFCVQNGGTAIHMLWQIADTSRIVFARVNDPQRKPAVDYARTIFASLEDRLNADYSYWCFYGLNLEVISEYVLESADLKLERLKLEFLKNKQTLTIERYPLGSRLLRETSLRKWVIQQLSERDFLVDNARDSDALPHPALEIEGTLPKQKRGTLFSQLLRIGRRAARVHAWHCPSSDRIFICQLCGKGELALKSVYRIKCHKS